MCLRRAKVAPAGPCKYLYRCTRGFSEELFRPRSPWLLDVIPGFRCVISESGLLDCCFFVSSLRPAPPCVGGRLGVRYAHCQSCFVCVHFFLSSTVLVAVGRPGTVTRFGSIMRLLLLVVPACLSILVPASRPAGLWYSLHC